MSTIGEQLKAFRQRSGFTIRHMASMLGFEQHNRYAYYESARFKGPLPVPLAKKIAEIWMPFGVEPEEVMLLAGLSRDESRDQAAAVRFLAKSARRNLVSLSVLLPSTDSLTLMFEKMLEDNRAAESSRDLAYLLALALPRELQMAPVDPLGEYRAFREREKNRTS